MLMLSTSLERLCLMADRRSKNRAHEHGSHGWQDVTVALAGRVKTPRLAVDRFCKCPCGWSGWVNPDVAPAVVVAS